MKRYVKPFINYGTLVGSIMFGGYGTIIYSIKDFNTKSKVDIKKNDRYNLIFFIGR